MMAVTFTLLSEGGGIQNGSHSWMGGTVDPWEVEEMGLFSLSLHDRGYLLPCKEESMRESVTMIVFWERGGGYQPPPWVA